jgi:hypothetical protein
MAKANIHRRSTLEEVYPPDAFASDAAQNGRVPNTMLSGIRILSAPDAAGDFDFERATRQIGESASASFLAPHRREEGTLAESAIPDPRVGYEAFLEDSSPLRSALASSRRNPPAEMNRACAGCGSNFHLLTSPEPPLRSGLMEGRITSHLPFFFL